LSLIFREIADLRFGIENVREMVARWGGRGTGKMPVVRTLLGAGLLAMAAWGERFQIAD